jgi:two-component system, LytTR family, sensor kinase
MRIKLLVHILFWATYIGGGLLIKSHFRPNGIHIANEIIAYMGYIFIVYTVALLVLPKNLPKKNYAMLGTSTLAIFFCYVLINYVNENYIEGLLYNFTPKLPLSGYFIPLAPFFIQYMLIGLGLYYYESNLQKQIELNLEQEKSRTLEKEKSDLELNYLRAQINPHFLLGTLNSIYIDLDDDEADCRPQATRQIKLLCNLMNYSLSRLEVDGKKLLSEEVEAVETLLELHELNFRESFAVDFTQEGDITDQRIMAHILLTLVENLLKFGHTTLADRPAKIVLRVKDNQLYFSVFNHIKENKDLRSFGIGIANIRRRLELVYPGRFTYDKESDEKTYKTTITINL